MVNTFIEERTRIDQEGKGRVTNDDCAVFSGRTEKGTLLSFISSRVGNPRMMAEICGEGGMMVYNPDHSNELEVLFKEKEGGYSGSKTCGKIAIPNEFKDAKGHQGVTDEFIECILEGKGLPVTWREEYICSIFWILLISQLRRAGY